MVKMLTKQPLSSKRPVLCVSGGVNGTLPRVSCVPAGNGVCVLGLLRRAGERPFISARPQAGEPILSVK